MLNPQSAYRSDHFELRALWLAVAFLPAEGGVRVRSSDLALDLKFHPLTTVSPLRSEIS